MNVEQTLQHYVDDMYAMCDEALAKTDEETVKMRMIGTRDVDTVLIEEYNNGWIDIKRLQKLSKLMKDRCHELVRTHTLKVESIEEAQSLKKLLDSERLHREEGRPRAIYDMKGDPRHDEEKIMNRFANRMEYLWRVRMSPALIVMLAIALGGMSAVIFVFEISLYLEWSAA